MKTKRTMSSWKFKSARREVRDRSVRLLLFLAIAALVSLWSMGRAGADEPILLEDIYPGGTGSEPENLTAVNGVMFFTADDGTHGKELWKSDGTAAGTVIVKDICPGQDSFSPGNLTDFNGTLFFSAYDGINGYELWMSDGTAPGTVMVKDIYTGGVGGYPSSLTDVNGTLFFSARDETNGPALWKSDGTEAGTVMVKDIDTVTTAYSPSSLTNVNGTLFFQANDGNVLYGKELWKSDGTEAGTVMVKDINPGQEWAFSGGSDVMTVFDGMLFFSANDGTHGPELWKSDGTEAGTVMVKDIIPGGGGHLDEWTNFNGMLFFCVSGSQLWKTDGTEAGTVLIKDFWFVINSWGVENLTGFDGVLFFNVSGSGLWRSDGTATGTVRVTGACPYINFLTDLNGMLFFAGYDDISGYELWQTDGTETGTLMIKDINPGATHGYPRDLTGYNDMLFFSADDGASGRELWRMEMPANQPPKVTLINDQTANVNQSVNIDFAVSDVETSSDDLEISITSDNQTLLPDANITLGGSGDNRNIVLTPVADQWGTAGITLTVSDGEQSTIVTFTATWQIDLIEVGPGGDYDNSQLDLAVDHVADGGIIVLKDGVYTLDDANNDGKTEIFLDGKRNITIQSENGPENTIIDLDYNGRAFVFQHGGTATTLEGLTIINGNIGQVTPTGTGDMGGGAIIIGGAVDESESHSLFITNCIFRNNLAKYLGGAIAINIQSPLTNIVISDCIFSKNSTDYYGGAIGLYTNNAAVGLLEFAGCEFSENSSFIGGAIFIAANVIPGDHTWLIRNSSFYKNVAQQGGAVMDKSGLCGVTGCAFLYNKALESGGAVSSCLTPKIENSIFLKNMALQDGGAIFASDPMIDYQMSDSGREAEITMIKHCTFADNEALDEGGAIYAGHNMAVYNSILWGNRAKNDGQQIYTYNESGTDYTLNIAFTDLEGGLNGISGSGESDYMVTVDSEGGMIDVEPSFALDEDLHLMSDSPCIDAGTNSPPGGVPPTGMDGNTRPLDGDGNDSATVDMGAYEFDRSQFHVLAISPERILFTAMEDGPLPEGQTLFVRNRGESDLGALYWKVSEEISWLRVEPAEGDSTGEPDAVRLYIDSSEFSNLDHGAYFGDLLITDDTGSQVFETVEVTLQVTGELHVPAEYTTIQEAIYAAIDGDVVLVTNGTYTGEGNKNIDFFGKAITLISENGPEYTIIDCENDDRAFYFRRTETSDSIVQGFTIKNGAVPEGGLDGGGGILVESVSSPTILDCIFLDSSAGDYMSGGAIYTKGPSTRISGCSFLRNMGRGGAIYIRGDFTAVENCYFSENSAGPSNAWGGAIVVQSNNVTINNCTFSGNTAFRDSGTGDGGAIYISSVISTTVSNSGFFNNQSARGGAITIWGAGKQSIYNCVFSANRAVKVDNGYDDTGEGGAICVKWSDLALSNCTFYSNIAEKSGGGIFVDGDKIATISNSIFWNNRYWDGVALTPDDITASLPETTLVSYCAISDSVNWPLSPENRILNNVPLFIDPDGPDDIAGNEDDDFRLDPTSPCIDRGKKIQWLFSDIRGSLRPVEIANMPRDAAGVPLTQDSAFDMGAYEFSEDYGGIEGDLTTKAFKDLKIGGSLVVTNFEYQVEWKDKDPFTFDTRINHAGVYDVNLALVNDAGLRIYLGTHTVEVSQHGYAISYTFGPEHIGTWRIRLELVSDPSQFALSDEFSIEYKEATRYALGQRILPPEGADPNVQPDVVEEDACYWSVETNRLYAIAPITTVVTWYGDEERTIPFPVVAYMTYPDQNYPSDPETQIHIADSMEVDLLPEGSQFELAEIMYAGNDATISANKFQAGQEGWAVLMYRDQQATDSDDKERFDVVRTLTWNHQDTYDQGDPNFPWEVTWDIGQKVVDACPSGDPDCIVIHEDSFGSGYVFIENTRYDAMAYDRETRQGPIFSVNEDDPDTEEDDLVVVWYNESTASNVQWPSKPVRYNAVWPTDAKKIVIASQLGSGPLDPAIYGQIENMLIYNQPDIAQPGYNGNEEHAAFFTPTDALYPSVFALRTDLNKPADNVTLYADGDRSRPYVLLKYLDPNTDAWAFEVFEVVAQSGSYMVQTGQVVADNGSNIRYYIDETHTLTVWTGALPGTAYYLDADGHLVNHSDSIVSAEQYYIDGSGQVITLAGDLPSVSYYLDVHGVIVESDIYYRFHYAGIAGEAISPPYPLNQPAFGPCSESYTSTETSVLKDKDNRFHAKHGGFNGEAAEDGVINYFYRLQPGFFYDLDDNGVSDETAGACIPWLGVVDGTTEDTPADITYAITWPDVVPTLYAGETLTDAKTQEGETVGMPNVADQCIVDVLFDQSVAEGGGPSAKLIDPLAEYPASCPLDLENNELQELKPEYSLSSQRWIFKALPEYMQVRLTYDDVTSELKLKGYYEAGTGEPLLLLNTLTQRDIMEISRPFLPDPNDLDPQTWTDTVIPVNFRTALYALRSAGDTGLTGASVLKDPEMKALTAGDAQTAPSYVTLAFNNDMDCPGPVTLSVIKVDCPLYRGEIKVIESDDAFEEKVTLRHNGDFGGNSDTRWFQWKYLPADFSGIPEGPGQPGEVWQDYFAVMQRPGTIPQELDPSPPGYGGNFYLGAVDVSVQGTGQQLLPDKWFSVRYYYPGMCDDDFSQWTKPQLYEGWVKRVMKKINLFDQKVKDFHESDVNTLASMISLSGEKYEGDVALSDDPDNLKKLGIIETYHTLLNRLKGLTIEQGVDSQDSNTAILFATSRLGGLYMGLGNEAFGDATDPTIGFSTEDGQYGTEAPSIFCFQNQVDSLLEEELVLLRGRADEGARPNYHRFGWNFTLGDGEVAYKENYNITDQETDQDGDGVPDAPDGVIDEKDAMVLYPQGHGDSWGHYLTAAKYYYDLLRHPSFTWIPQTEAILVDQTPVEVDYRDERQFAKAAAAKAKTGAEIVNLTYRQNYVEDPEGQWQGYKDADADRAWGVDGWSRRAGQGALFDWLVGNAILPAEDTDPDHEGIAKVDRKTVVELREVASQYAAVQAEIDRADVGLNPLGLAKDAVPFDIDPGGIANGQTHFEQIYDRAVQAMNNSIAVFNHANQSTMLLRRQQDTLADFKRNIENTEADFNNRLIEVFGYPYPDDDAYSADYCQTGPDLYHYMYVEPSELMGVEAPRVHEFTATFKDIDVDAAGALQETEQSVQFHVDTDNRFGLIKPPEWQGRRKAPGEIQLARSDLLQARGRFEKALVEYDNLIGHIEKQADLIEAQHGLNSGEIMILNRAKGTQETLNSAIRNSRSRQLLYRSLGSSAVILSNALAEAWPTNTGVIAGLAGGVIFDATSGIRSGIKLVGQGLDKMMSGMADLESLAELDHQHAKEIVSAQTNIQLTALRGEFAVEQQLLQLENLIRTEATLRLEIYNLSEGLQQSAGRYLASLARGERLLQDRLRFRKQTAAQIQDYRYKDMTFRIFRNDALQKYRAQFDLAAMYVYLAAKAYDYETTLLDYDSMAGQAFFTDIVRQRTIGMIENGQPLTGTGLADPMKRMWQNFQVLKPQLGFNNPQEETNRFSLRREFFRIKMDDGSTDTWQQVLDAHRVDDLWDIPEFRRHCRPFADEGIPQPGIVIPFSTTVTSGLNFFEWPLGGNDSYYSATNFATKVRSVGVWFSNYNSVQLAQTPRIYLVPVGEDVLRTPAYHTRDIRTWHVVDQKLPIPFPIVGTELENNPGWIPTVDTIFDEMFQIRRHSDFRAYHDSGYVNESEMTFDSRLVGRSVWNTGWLLIIPGQNLLYDADEGIDRFIHGPEVIGGTGERTGNGVWDIKLFFHTYAYSGN